MKTTRILLGISMALSLAACGSVTPSSTIPGNTAWDSIKTRQSQALSRSLELALPDRQYLLKDAGEKDTSQQVVVAST